MWLMNPVLTPFDPDTQKLSDPQGKTVIKYVGLKSGKLINEAKNAINSDSSMQPSYDQVGVQRDDHGARLFIENNS